MVDPLCYFSFQPLLDYWNNKGCGMCSPVMRWSLVRVFAHGTMVRRIDPLWWTHCAISHSSQFSTIGITKAVVCVLLSVGWSLVRAFAHGAMGHRIDPLYYFSFQCSTMDNKSHCMYYPVCGMAHLKEPLLLFKKSSPCSSNTGFFCHYLNGLLPCVCHISVNKIS